MIEQILEADRMLQVDQVERARELYQRVVDLDPGNAIAVVGLAQCALADGDDQRAYELASRALAIDPENDMARRMESRLAEIMATRGEGVERPAEAATLPSHALRPIVTEEANPPPSSAGTAAETAAGTAPETAAGTAAETAAGTAPETAAGTAPETGRPSTSATAPTPSASVRSTMRKSFVDRLLGR